MATLDTKEEKREGGEAKWGGELNGNSREGRIARPGSQYIRGSQEGEVGLFGPGWKNGWIHGLSSEVKSWGPVR